MELRVNRRNNPNEENASCEIWSNSIKSKSKAKGIFVMYKKKFHINSYTDNLFLEMTTEVGEWNEIQSFVSQIAKHNSHK